MSGEAEKALRRRGVLRLGAIAAAISGTYAASATGASSAQAAPGDKNPPADTYVPIAEKGVASGVATLGSDSKIPKAQIPDLSSAFVSVNEITINAARYPSPQAALDAAPAGSRVYFPSTMSPVTIPAGGLILKSNGLTIDAMSCEFHVATWGTPAFLALRSNNGADDHTFRIGLVKYVGTRGTHLTGGVVRGSAAYCSGSGVWSNGDRNYVEYLRTEGMPTPIFFASWDGIGMNDRTGVGNRIGYLHANGYDFGLLYVKQEAFDWGNAYCHDDIDDSGGANQTHAIYCSASAGQRSGRGQMGRWLTERNYGGHAYLFKFADGITFGTLISDDCAGVLSAQNVSDFVGDIVSGTRVRGLAADRSVLFSGTERCKRVNVGRIDVKKAAGDNTPAIGLWVDETCEVGSIITESEHVGSVNPAVPEVLVRGIGAGSIRSVLVKAKGVPARPVDLGDGTLAGQAAGWNIPSVRSLGTDAAFNAIPVGEVPLSHSNAWGDGSNWLSAAAPAKGIFRRGMRWAAAAPSVGAARGWTQTANGALSGGAWMASSTARLGSWVRLADGRVIRYITDGTTGATEPGPTTVGQTGADGTAMYEYMATTSGAVASDGNL
ncbi:hypothetical protein [Pseudarthrobacter sp. C1]|uniref:hypothetical protein n=1 Tax=Pseudarthrobacter sp. C1 TaxID=3108940 RepID=UPI002B051D81|nr:hypothetical protein [Pseudarthrobacter sp. C1]MEA3550239.1 hypothetical protein [Pseudarthrobacter sp. C1]